jgi:hypothetical protein
VQLRVFWASRVRPRKNIASVELHLSKRCSVDLAPELTIGKALCGRGVPTCITLEQQDNTHLISRIAAQVQETKSSPLAISKCGLWTEAGYEIGKSCKWKGMITLKRSNDCRVRVVSKPIVLAVVFGM